MNKGTKKKWNNGQSKFPRCNLALKEFDGTHQSMREAWRATLKEFDGTHQSMREAWRAIKLDWIKDYN